MLGTSYSDYVIAKTEQNKRMPSDYTWNNVEHCGQGAKSQGSVIQKGLSSEGGGSVEVYNTKPIHLWTTQKTHLSIYPPATPGSMKASPNLMSWALYEEHHYWQTKEVLASS